MTCRSGLLNFQKDGVCVTINVDGINCLHMTTFLSFVPKPVAASAVEEAEHEVQDAGDDPLQQIAQVVLERFGPQIPCAEGIATLADVEARQQAAYALAAAQRERSCCGVRRASCCTALAQRAAQRS